jgi:hypothetical protein
MNQTILTQLTVTATVRQRSKRAGVASPQREMARTHEKAADNFARHGDFAPIAPTA